MLIFRTAACAQPDRIDAWARSNNSQALPIDAADLPSLDRAAAQHRVTSSGPVMVVDYQVESDVDIQTLEDFRQHILANSGHWYYAPRPNHYVAVTKPSLFGVSLYVPPKVPNLFLGVEDVERLRHRVGHAINSLPKPAQGIARSAGRVAWRVYRGLSHNSGAQRNAVGGNKFSPTEQSARHEQASHVASSNPADLALARQSKPKIAVPATLQALERDWQPFDPSPVTMRRDMLERAATFMPHPLGIHVIVLNKCNLACVMCPYHSPSYKQGHTSGYFDDYRSMKPEVFEKIADYAGKHKISLQFGQIEEPLMHKRVIDFIRIAKDRGVPFIHMTTNGTLLTPDRADKLLESGLTSLMVSIDSTDPETYKAIRGDDLEKVEANLRYFAPRARERGIKTWASFILQPEASTQKEVFLERWRGAGLDHVTYYMLAKHDLNTGELVDHELMYDREEKRYPCASPWVQSVVFPDGEVSLCCRTMTLVGWKGVISVGSLQQSTYEEIWKGHRYQRARQELLNDHFEKFEVCSNCAIWSASTAIVEKTKTYERVYNETMETYTFNH